MKNGQIANQFKKVLLRLGQWLDTNGEAIYDTSPWVKQRDSFDSDVWYTCKKTKYNPYNPTMIPGNFDIITTIYVIFLSWPGDNVLRIKDLTSHLINAKFHIYMVQPVNKKKVSVNFGYDAVTLVRTWKEPKDAFIVIVVTSCISQPYRRSRPYKPSLFRQRILTTCTTLASCGLPS